MTQLYLSPIGILLQQLSNLGIPLAGGLVNIYVAGTVNTPQASFTDSTGTTLNANPIVLNSAGRLANANAPCSVWVPANTPHKMVLTDAAGNLLSGGASMDNLLGIDDPTGPFSSLINPATGFGADLVANAVRSYDVIASVRAANVPVLAAGQTLVIDIEGGVLINDGQGGIFQWSSTSTAADDGVLTIKPTAILAAAPGRYVRQQNIFGLQGTFTMAVQGTNTNPLIQFWYVQNGGPAGGTVTLSWQATGALLSNATSFGFAGFPNGLQGVTQPAQSGLLAAEDNGVNGVACYMTIQNQIGGSSVILTPNNASGLWTNPGNKQLYRGSWTYNTF